MNRSEQCRLAGISYIPPAAPRWNGKPILPRERYISPFGWRVIYFAVVLVTMAASGYWGYVHQ